MQVMNKYVAAAIMASFIPQASAVNLSTYPVSLLGSQANAAAQVAKGPVACRMTGVMYIGGGQLPYAGHVMLMHDGIQDVNGFGHFKSPAGKESFVQYSVAYDNAGSSGGHTCYQKLNITDSKYAVNKFGVGISELHWDADTDTAKTNLGLCTAFVDQMGWVMDNTGARSVTTRINEAETTAPFSAQSVDCFRSK